MPQNGAPGSLGQTSSITVDTTPPTIIAVLSPSRPGVYRHRTAVQTVEISWGSWRVPSPVLHSGSFTLSHGASTTDCINATATASDIQLALGTLFSIDNRTVAVSDEAAPHDNSRRFAVNFDALYRSAGIQELKINLYGLSCSPWTCIQARHGKVGPCEMVSADVVEFRGSGYSFWPGFVDVILRFSAPVDVHTSRNSVPYIGLDIINRKHELGSYLPNATFTRGSLVQSIDVGVFASAPIVAGQFRLQYGDSKELMTACTDFETALSPIVVSAGGERNLRSRLEELQPIAAVGLESVTVKRLGNGSRFRVQFKAGSNPLRLYPVEGGDCQAFEPAKDANVTIPPSTDLTFRYAVQNGDMTVPHLRVASRHASSGMVAIHLNGSSIRRDSTHPTTVASLFLPTSEITAFVPSSEDKVQCMEGHNIVIDSSQTPTVLNVTTSTWSDMYGVNEWVDFFITFTVPVFAEEGALLLMRTGNRDQEGAAVLRAEYSIKSGYRAVAGKFGNGSKTLCFQYRIRYGDETHNLVPRTEAAIVGIIKSAQVSQTILASTKLPDLARNASFQNATSSLAWAPNNYSVDRGFLRVSTYRPKVVAIHIDKPNGTYTVGEDIFIHVVFSEPVSTKGAVALTLNSGGTAYLRRNAGNEQTFDIGADASSQLHHGCCGSFRFAYKSSTTSCIQWDNASAILRAVHNLAPLKEINGLLDEWPRPFELGGYDYHGGYRWKLKFLNGGRDSRQYPASLKPVLCDTFSPPNDGSARANVAETHTLAFAYTIKEGEMTKNLDISGPDALQLLPAVQADIRCNKGKDEIYIRRASTRPTQDANLTIVRSVFAPGGVQVNTSAPRVEDVSCMTGQGPYTEGDIMVFRVRFSAVVHLRDESGAELVQRSPTNALCDQHNDGHPALSLALSTQRSLNWTAHTPQSGIERSFDPPTNATSPLILSIARARYINGSGSRDLYLQYVVRPHESVTCLDYANGSALHVKKGFRLLADSTNPSKAATLKLPSAGRPGSISYDQNITIASLSREDTYVQRVTASVREGCYYPGDLIHIHVFFSRCVETPSTLEPNRRIVLGLNTALAGHPERILVAAPDKRNRPHARMIVFPWLIGSDDHSLRVQTLQGSLRIEVENDTAFPGTRESIRSRTILRDSQGYRAVLRLPMPGKEGALDSSVILAVHHGHRGQRADPLLVKTPNSPRALRTSTNVSGVIRTVGDEIFISVHFDSLVSIHCTRATSVEGHIKERCPSLVLQVKGGELMPQAGHEWINWGGMESAIYCDGNGTDTLIFR